MTKLSFADQLFIKALSLYSAGKMEDAYPILENFFSDKKNEKVQLIRSALILAYAPNSLLRQHKRHYYAKYYLENNESTLPQKNKSALYRIIADGYFDETKFDEAIPYYKKLGAVSGTPSGADSKADSKADNDLRNRAYAEYRLGWIELNTDRANQAFSRWSNFLQKDGAELFKQDADLYRSIIKDTGRSWVELYEPSNVSTTIQTQNKFSEIDKIQNIHDGESDLAEGIVLGLKRVTKLETISRFHQDLASSNGPHKDAVFDKLLTRGIVFTAFPCDVISWVNFPLLSTQRNKTLEYLTICARNVVNGHLCEQAAGKALFDFYEKIATMATIEDAELSLRANLAVGCKKWSYACRDFIEMNIRHSQTKGQRSEKEITEALFETCSQININEIDSDKFLRLISIYAEKGLFEKNENDPIYSTFRQKLSDSNFRNKTITAITAVAASNTATPVVNGYAKTLIPHMLLDTMSETEKNTHEEVFLKQFAPLPPAFLQKNGPWISLLESVVKKKVESKKTDEVDELLNKYIPLESISKNQESDGPIKIWQYFWLSLEENQKANHEKKVGEWLAHTKKTSTTFVIALYFEMINFIWENFSSYISDKNIKEDLWAMFYQKSLQLLSTPAPTPAAALTHKLLERYPQGKTLIRIMSKDPGLTMAEIKKIFKKGMPLLADMEVLNNLGLQSKKIKKGKLNL
ncbi:MAG: hypothetical protein HQK53_16895, partial [Oligoflexia bacterium]|nr:hypothetical protein [Oligoflexia bacterium]